MQQKGKETLGLNKEVNPAKVPTVVDALLDSECKEDFVKNLINSVRFLVHVDELIAEVEERNKLQILNNFLEKLVSEGSTDTHVHNALEEIHAEEEKAQQDELQSSPFQPENDDGQRDERESAHFKEEDNAMSSCMEQPTIAAISNPVRQELNAYFDRPQRPDKDAEVQVNAMPDVREYKSEYSKGDSQYSKITDENQPESAQGEEEPSSFFAIFFPRRETNSPARKKSH